MIKDKAINVNSGLTGNDVYYAEPLEVIVSRIYEKGEIPSVDDTKMYTESAQGVIPETDIRTDKFDMALEAVIAAQKTIAEKAAKVVKANSGEEE